MTPRARARNRAWAAGIGAVLVAGLVVVFALRAVTDDDAVPRGAAALTKVLTHSEPAEAPFAELDAVRLAVGGRRCLRLVVADTLAEREAGLRGRTRTRPYDGMLFVFESPTSAGFTMAGVSEPLDIAFFAPDGSRTSTRAMPACPDKASNECPVYRSEGAFLYALETPRGELPGGDIAPCGAGS